MSSIPKLNDGVMKDCEIYVYHLLNTMKSLGIME